MALTTLMNLDDADDSDSIYAFDESADNLEDCNTSAIPMTTRLKTSQPFLLYLPPQVPTNRTLYTP